MVRETEAILDTPTLDALRREGGDAFVDELIRTYLAQLDVQQVQLAEARARSDRATLAFVAHTIAGSAGDVGGARVGRLAREIERLASENAGNAEAFEKVALLREQLTELTAALCAHLAER